LLLQSGAEPAATSHASTCPFALQSYADGLAMSHSSGIALRLQSRLVPPAMSSASSTPLSLQSIPPTRTASACARSSGRSGPAWAAAHAVSTPPSTTPAPAPRSTPVTAPYRFSQIRRMPHRLQLRTVRIPDVIGPVDGHPPSPEPRTCSLPLPETPTD